MTSRFKILLPIIGAVLLLDQLTKQLVLKHIPFGDSIPIIPNFFDLVHVRNPGAAFGFMGNLPDSIRGPFFFLMSGVTLILLTVYFFRLKDPRHSVYACLGLILGGALGNIWDRIVLGEVVDFLSFHWYDRIARFQLGTWQLAFRLEWPAFNVADMAITTAVLGLIVLMMKSPQEGA